MHCCKKMIPGGNSLGYFIWNQIHVPVFIIYISSIESPLSSTWYPRRWGLMYWYFSSRAWALNLRELRFTSATVARWSSFSMAIRSISFSPLLSHQCDTSVTRSRSPYSCRKYFSRTIPLNCLYSCLTVLLRRSNLPSSTLLKVDAWQLFCLFAYKKYR